jgi:gliding motility-associated-like protein
MKRFLFLFAFLQSICFGQVNLVPNWSLENFSNCPDNANQLNYAQYWYSPTPNSPDYFNACSSTMNVPYYGSGYQLAKDGQAYVGIFLWDKINVNDREYIQSILTDTLTSGKLYCVGFWINLSDFSRYAVNRVGAYLSINPVSTGITYLPYTPQMQNDSDVFLTDNLRWTLITGTYLAAGGERYITIGNFSPDTYTDSLLVLPDPGMVNNGYYFIDAVFVYECDSTKIAEAGVDRTICKDSSVRIGGQTLQGCHYRWSPSEGLDNDTVAMPYAHPEQTTTYYVLMSDPFYQLTADTVTVYVDENCLPSQVFIPTIFSPNGDGNNDEFFVRGQYIKDVHFSVYDRWGQIVFESVSLSAGWSGQYKNKDCPEGVYFYVAELTYDNGDNAVKKGNVTLIR